MKAVDCYLCGSGNSEILFKQGGADKYLMAIFEKLPEKDLNWMICKDCSFVYRSPVLEENEYIRLYEKYDSNIFVDTTPDAYFDKIISLPLDKSENKQKIEWLKYVLEKKSPDKISTVLDIGCGGGTLLYSLHERIPSLEIFGVELNPGYADLAKRRLEGEIRNESYSSGVFNKKFDLIINTKVLEHIPDPLPFLSEIAEDLIEDGFFFIEVPDVSDMYNLSSDNERFSIPHIFFYSRKTLTFLLNRVGFSVLDARVYKATRNRAYLQIVAKKQRNKIPLPTLEKSGHVASKIAKTIKANMTDNSRVADEF